MRNLFSAAALLFIFALVSCSSEAINSVDLISLPSPPEENKILLEIAEGLKHRSAKTEGFLSFRLYADGTIEFDDFPEFGSSPAPDRKKARITYQEVEEFRFMLASNKFKNLKNEYQKITPHCDYGYNPIIKSQNKTIEVEWCSAAEFDPQFPEILSELIKKTAYVTEDFRNH